MSLNKELKKSYLLKTREVVLETDGIKKEDAENQLYLASVLMEMRKIGFAPDEKLFQEMSCMDKEQLVEFYNENMPTFREIVGADVNWVPMYRNFPEEVMNMSDFELYWNAITYYSLTIGMGVDGREAEGFVSKEEEKPRLPFREENEPKIIGLGSEENVMEQAKNIVESKVTVSPADREFLEKFIHNAIDSYDRVALIDFYDNLKPQNKENGCLFSALVLKDNSMDDRFKQAVLSKTTKNVNDVLRLATYMSTETTDLSINVKYKYFSKPEARMLMSLLDNCPNIKVDMFKHEEKWKRLAKSLHISNFEKKFPGAVRAMQDVCKGNKGASWDRDIENAIAAENYQECKRLLSQRPGEMISRLNKFADIAVKAGQTEDLYKTVSKHAGKASMPLLIREINNLKDHIIGIYENKKDKDGNNVVYVNKKAKPLLTDENVRNRLAEILRIALVEETAKKEYLGKVYLPRVAEDINLSTKSMANANSSTLNVEKGSRLPLREGKNSLRFSVWWTNGEVDDKDGNKVEARTDVDFHLKKLGKNYENRGSISYWALRDPELKAHHSGDITNGGPIGGEGAAEFIDVSDINKELLLSRGIYYLQMEAVVFTGAYFGQMPCRVSYQERQADKMQEGQLYEASAVTQAINVTASGKSICPFIYDVEKEQMILVDQPVYQRDQEALTIHGTRLCSDALLKAMVERPRMTMKDFMDIQVESGRAILVDTPEEADIIIGINRPEELKDGQTFLPLFNPTDITAKYLDNIERPEEILNRTNETKYHVWETYEKVTSFADVMKDRKGLDNAVASQTVRYDAKSNSIVDFEEGNKYLELLSKDKAFIAWMDDHNIPHAYDRRAEMPLLSDHLNSSVENILKSNIATMPNFTSGNNVDRNDIGEEI